MIETPHTEHNSCNPASRFAVSYATVIQRETKVPKKELSQQLSQASPLMSYMCPVLSHLHWPRQLFLGIGSRGRYRKRGIHLPLDEKTGQGSSHKRNPMRKFKTLRAINLLFILPRNVRLPQMTQKIQTELTETLNKSETCYIKKMKKEQS